MNAQRMYCYEDEEYNDCNGNYNVTRDLYGNVDNLGRKFSVLLFLGLLITCFLLVGIIEKPATEPVINRHGQIVRYVHR